MSLHTSIDPQSVSIVQGAGGEQCIGKGTIWRAGGLTVLVISVSILLVWRLCMKMIKCDRCGKKEEIMGSLFSAGIEPVYFGRVTQYRLGEIPDIHGIDLCTKCQDEYDVLTREFMEKSK